MRWIAVAIVIAGALIAAVVALTNHFSMAGTGNSATVFRMNNWSGEVTLCWAETSHGLGPRMNCRSEKDDWIPVPKNTDEFGGVRIPDKSK